MGACYIQYDIKTGRGELIRTDQFIKRFGFMKICWIKASVGLNAHIKKSRHAKKKKQVKLLLRTFLSQFQACFVLRKGKNPKPSQLALKNPDHTTTHKNCVLAYITQSIMFFHAYMTAITTKQMPAFFLVLKLSF